MGFLFQDQKLDTADKIELVVSYLLQLTLLGFISYLIYNQDWLNAVLVAGILLLTFIPAIVRRNYSVHLPLEFDLITIVFLYMALFLGEIQSYYSIYWWWDVILHTSSGFLLGILGFVLVYVLNEQKKINVLLHPKFMSLFSFVFAVALGAIWEIIEFTLDQTLGLQMQHGSLLDTMWDLIVDTLGALVISVLGYFFMKKKGFLLFDRMVHRFVESNPGIFKDRKIKERIKHKIMKTKERFRIKR